MDMTALVIAMCIPSAITGFCFWLIERSIQRRDEAAKEERERARKREEERDKQRRDYELFQLNMTAASMALAEATARAVERIPDAECNGDMHAALEYARKIKEEQKDFLRQQAVRGLDF